MRFEHPQLLLFVPLGIPLLAAFLWWAWRARRRALTAFVAARLLPGLTESVSASRQKLRLALLVAAATLLILTLARPQIGFSWDEAKSRGLDVVVAIDTSRSMLAADVAPNRLKRAQLAALDLKRLASGDRFGVVAFAGSAFLQCPLTVDSEVYRQSVESLDVNIIPQGGTALAEAIQAARGAFKEGNDNHKVLVIFTDGEDHDGNALESARAAGKDGMRIFTIGVGTPDGELLRLTDTQGRSEFLKDAEGNVVKSRLNEDLLKQMAQETGGFYMRMSGANTMDLLYERGLAPLPRGEIGAQRIKRYHERYQWVLGAVIVLLLLEMFVPARKSTKSASKVIAGGAATVAKTTAVMLFLMMPLLATASAGRALREYEKGRYDQAFSNYEDALKKKPDDARLHYNAGAAAFQNKDYPQALEHLNSALVTQDLGLQQRAYYNIGNSQFRLGEETSESDKKMKLWEQAVKSFESALKLEAKDADAQFNQEFVKRKLEELKQQQQQQNQQQDKDDKKDQEKKDQQQQQNKDQQSKADQQKQQEQQQKQQQDQQQQNQQGQKPEDQQAQQQKQKDQQQASKPEQKPGEKEKAQQASKSDGKENEQGEDAGDPQSGAMMRMTPEQAIRLLEAFKAEEKNLPLRPVLKTNRQDRVFKDW